MNNHLIQSLWVGDRLPVMQYLSVRSFLANGHAYDLYVYEDLANAPEGVRLRDAREIMPVSEVFRNFSHNTFATFSDIFRYRLLSQYGGWWSDTDVICLRPFDFSEDYVFSSEHRILNGVVREVATITVMKAPPASELFQKLYEASAYRDKSKLKWNEIGSDLLRSLLRDHALQSAVQRATTFCPIPMIGYESVVDPTVRFVFESSTFAAHLWHELWRRKGLDVDACYPPDCFYEQLKSVLIYGASTALERSFVVEER